MTHRFLLIGLLGALGIASAAEWSSFEDAFPGLPCNDGWSACLVDGAAVTPGMVRDAEGRPHPSDMRVGFFDLQPLPGFSPFTGLSAYTGQEPAPEPVAAAGSRQDNRRQDNRRQDNRRPAAQRPGDGRHQPASTHQRPGDMAAAQPETDAAQPAVAVAARDTGSVANAEPSDAYLSSRPGARVKPASQAMRPATLTEEPENTGTAHISVEPMDVAEPEPTAPAIVAPEPETRAPEPEPEVTAPEITVAEVAPPSAPVTPPPAANNSTTCDDLVALESAAMMGKLGVARRKCLEGALAGASQQTQRNKISRVLISDAEGRRDPGDWERLMKRHLETIDRSDPDLCLKYAIQLSREGVGRAHGVIRWADYALENKQRWSGATHKKRVYALLKLKAQAANRLWTVAEKKYVEDRNDDNESKAVRYRGMAKDYAREWLDYARASGQDTKTAMSLCVSAAGNKEFCDG